MWPKYFNDKVVQFIAEPDKNLSALSNAEIEKILIKCLKAHSHVADLDS